MGPGLKTWGLRVLKGQQTQARSTGLRVSSEKDFRNNYTQIFLFLKSHHLVKRSHLIFLYIIRYNSILWRPHNPRLFHNPSPKIWACSRDTPNFPTQDSRLRLQEPAFVCISPLTVHLIYSSRLQS